MARNVFGVGAGTPEKNRNQMLSALAGQSVQSVDPDLQAYYERLDMQENVDKMIQGLRDEGLVPRSTRKKSKFDTIIEDILKGNY